MDPALISNPVEKQWVVEITKILDHQIKINREIPSVSIFHLPESITTKKPEAYEPQWIGLGPIHHFRPGPYRIMEQQKLLVARKDLQEIKKEDGKLIVLNKVRELVPIVRELVPVVRSCYNIFLQDDDESLAMIFAIDGLFLLDLFQTYNIGMVEKEAYFRLLKEKVKQKIFKQKKGLIQVLKFLQRPVVTPNNRRKLEEELGLPHKEFPKPKIGTTRRKIVQDIMMVGNQIPLMVLKGINEGLHPSSAGSFSPSNFRTFCKIHSPLKLCPKSQAPTNNVEHVLHYMYYSILNNYKRTLGRSASLGKIPINFTSKVPKEEITRTEEIIQRSAPRTRSASRTKSPRRTRSVSPSSASPRSAAQQRSASLRNIDAKVEEVLQVIDQGVSVLKTFTQRKILIQASKLHDKAGFMFHTLQKHEGIQNIYKQDNDIYLPCVTLNNDSEVILRNLVAYETLTANPDKFPLTEYMGLMCALIVNVDDVKYLRDHEVIDGEMGNDEVAKLFIGMSTSIQPIKTKEKSDLQKMIDEVNTVYKERLEMKMHSQLQKLAGWLLAGLKAFGKFLENSWKILAFIFSIVTMFMLTYQAYCNIYGCDKSADKWLPYASS